MPATSLATKDFEESRQLRKVRVNEEQDGRRRAIAAIDSR
jgi:hypothetical protein